MKVRRRSKYAPKGHRDGSYRYIEVPPELDEVIIGFIIEDLKLIKLCALVCRSWLVPCRRVLFREITIESEKQYDALDAVVTVSPFIQECIRVLRLDRSNRPHSINQAWINDKLAPRLSPLLINLTTIELTKIQESWKLETFTHLSKLQSVTKLSMKSCSMSSAELYYFVSSFPSAEELHVDHFVDLFNNRLRIVPPNLSLPRPPLLTRLTLASEDLPRDCGRDLLDWILEGGQKHCLRDICMSINRRNLAKRSLFLAQLGNQLHHLELQFTRLFGRTKSDISAIIQALNLSANASLKSITFPISAHAAVLPLLSLMRAPRLERIYFRLNNMKQLDLRAIGRQLEELLEFNFKNVQEVAILYAPLTLTHEVVRDRVEDAFPTLREKDMIRVVEDTGRLD